jgi:hypothetical protein
MERRQQAMGCGAIDTGPYSDLAHRERGAGAQQQFDDRQCAIHRLHSLSVGRRASTAMRVVRIMDTFIQLVRHATIVSPRVV